MRRGTLALCVLFACGDSTSQGEQGESSSADSTSTATTQTTNTTPGTSASTTPTSASATTSTVGTSSDSSTTGSTGPGQSCDGFDVGDAPYPSSPVLCGVTWDEDVVRFAQGSDNWPLTWAEDGDLYTTYGDGWGFDPMVPDKLSIGFAKVTGDPPNVQGINIPSDGEQTGDGASGKKASGIIALDGSLFILVRNADGAGEQCEVWRSDDDASTWTVGSWTFAELGYCAFLNYGQNNAGAPDDFVYAYMSDHPSAYTAADQVILARVPKDSIMERATWEFFDGIEGADDASWSAEISERAPVFQFPGGCNRLDVTFDATHDRYLMAMRARAEIDHFSIYDAPSPWGPWTTVFYTEGWDVDPGEVAHIPSKWISLEGGDDFYLVFAGDDAFSVRKGVFARP